MPFCTFDFSLILLANAGRLAVSAMSWLLCTSAELCWVASIGNRWRFVFESKIASVRFLPLASLCDASPDLKGILTCQAFDQLCVDSSNLWALFNMVIYLCFYYDINIICDDTISFFYIISLIHAYNVSHFSMGFLRENKLRSRLKCIKCMCFGCTSRDYP